MKQLLHMTIPLLITFILSLFYAFQYFVPHESIKDTFSFLLQCTMIIGCFAALLGIYSLVRVHAIRIKRRGQNWKYSYITISFLTLTIIVGMFGSIEKGAALKGHMYYFIYTSILIPIQATMFSLLAFFIASAAYRAFRARSLVATVLLLTAVFVMIGRVPIGEYLHIIPGWLADSLGIPTNPLPAFAHWLLNVPNLAAKRAIAIGIGLGASATALKVALGIERSHLGG